MTVQAGDDRAASVNRRQTYNTRGSRMDHTGYRVVVNPDNQYSIWPSDLELPVGWSDAGRAGTKEECLAQINELWIDRRPLTARH
jgi:MbtH protein